MIDREWAVWTYYIVPCDPSSRRQRLISHLKKRHPHHFIIDQLIKIKGYSWIKQNLKEQTVVTFNAKKNGSLLGKHVRLQAIPLDANDLFY